VKLALSENGGTLTNPFGRKHTFFDKEGDEKYRKAINWMTQSPVRDVMGKGMIKLVERLLDLEIILEAHDAIVFQCEERNWREYARIAKDSLTIEMDFSRCSLGKGKLILPIDVMMSDTNYKELRKVEL
jgi:DNA polymerase I-like protein with 3'-5' exonuclease and polymerase domains